jgi:SAM-dependent methyltransferase
MPAISSQAERQIAAERTYWASSDWEGPRGESLRNLLNKMQEAPVANELFAHYADVFAGARHVLEVGGGQGWASCLLKRRHPAVAVTMTDVAPAAVASHATWQRVYATVLDTVVAAPAWHVPVAAASVDVVFAFAAAHHFVDHAAVLAEHWRVLRPGGVALWLYEPTSPAVLRPLVERRANRKGMAVPEHVFDARAVLRTARAQGFTATAEYWPSTTHRSRIATAYYSLLQIVPGLQPWLPCTCNFVFRKPADSNEAASLVPSRPA